MSGFSINTNNNAMAALRTLNQTNRSLTEVQNRINTGEKVSGAKDNASTFAIAQGMRGDIAGLKSVQNTLQLGETTVNVTLKAAELISSKLNEMKGKIVDGQATNTDRAAIQQDINSLSDQITAIAEAAQFNGLNLSKGVGQDLTVLSSLNRTNSSSVDSASMTILDADMTASGLAVDAINIQDGYATFTMDNTAAISHDESVAFDAGGITYTFVFNDGTGAATLPTQDATNKSFIVDYDAADSAMVAMDKMAAAINASGEGLNARVNTETGALEVRSSAGDVDGAATTIAAGVTGANVPVGDPATALTSVEDAINTMKEHVARLGTASNELSTQRDFVKSLSDALTEGVSSLVDADMAEEAARLQALQTKQQLGMQALSIANQGPGAVLSLFR